MARRSPPRRTTHPHQSAPSRSAGGSGYAIASSDKWHSPRRASCCCLVHRVQWARVETRFVAVSATPPPVGGSTALRIRCLPEMVMTDYSAYSPAHAASQPQSPEVRLLERVRDRTDVGAWAGSLRRTNRCSSVRQAAGCPPPMSRMWCRKSSCSWFRRWPGSSSTVRGQFRSWLWRITSNAAANWTRKRVSQGRAEAAWCRLQHENSRNATPQ